MRCDACGGEIACEIDAMRLRVASDDCIDDGDADAAADVAEEIVEAAGVADLLVAERAHGDGGERNEDEAGAGAGGDDGAGEGPLAGGGGGVGHPECGPREDDVAGSDEPAI